MAAVSISPAQYNIGVMSARRPLASVPNAANSPYRTVSAAASKRTRQQLDAQEDLIYDQEPPAKRQSLINGRLAPRTPPQKNSIHNAEGRVFGKRPAGSQPTAFERRLLEAKENRVSEEARVKHEEQKVERQSKLIAEPLEEIRQWQKHYRRVFPTFVFYFESLPDDLRTRHSKFIRIFGAREEKFFSKEVTHVVTSRPIPTGNDDKAPSESLVALSAHPSSQNTSQLRTINPSLLERVNDAHPQAQSSQSRSKLAFEAAIGRKGPSSLTREVELKKCMGNVDILQKAKDMGMKIWSLEKIERISRTMQDRRVDDQNLRGPLTRSHAPTAGLAAKVSQEANLSRMLQDEQLNGPSVREASAYSSGIVPFKGPYIYVRCLDEMTKPILLKEWPKVSRYEEGEWPQFRTTSAGKCPFIQDNRLEEIADAKTNEEKIHIREESEEQRPPRTRAAAAAATRTLNFDPPRRQPLRESRVENINALPVTMSMVKSPQAPPTPILQKKRSPMKAPDCIPIYARPRLFGGEPAASGMQPSNITSAIRSQMISSTSAAPGAKTGTSKEVHGLKRRVLEKNSVPVMKPPPTRRVDDSLGAARAERHIPVARQTRRQAQERLIHIDEESTQSEDEDVWRVEEVQRRSRALGQPLKKHPRPGYCENCRDKYDDFDEHIMDRTHRKFALSDENWKDLDKLLLKLGRPLKEPNSDGF